MFDIFWLRKRKIRRLSMRIGQLKKTVEPFHRVLSTLRSEGPKKDYPARVILKEIQAREKVIVKLEGVKRGLEK